MCGITGFISPTLNKEHLEKMTFSLQHRGPDAQGIYFQSLTNKSIGFGHRRLSILDLSDAANQPFESQCERYLMVFNGEVYNFQEIRKQLPNISWKTNGDTEVLIEAFALWGVEFVHKLNGMFVISIWDKKEEKLFIFRDRLGIKPLFYFKSSNEFIFASELKALTSIISEKEKSINQTAIANFLYLGYIPNDESIFENIRKFPAGNYGVYDNGNLTVTKYWKAEEKIISKPQKKEQEAKKQLDSLLHQSVKHRMVSDVPLGVFLSGGIDSSTVAAISQANSSTPIDTFSIGFKDTKNDETKYARRVAKHLGTSHHEFILSKEDALERFEKVLNIYDEPFADSSAIPTMLVSEMTRKKATVALSGDGGDELFLGYGMYNWAKRLHNPFIKASHNLIASSLKSLKNNKYKRAALVFDYQNKQRIKSHIFSQEQYFFSEKEINQLLKKKTLISITEEFGELARNLNPMEQQALFDLNNYLKDDLLVKVDRASMFASLEVRVPFLDHNIVEFALNLDSSLKFKNGEMKYLLKQVLYDYVPSPIFDRPKWGFSIPLNVWLKTEFKYLIDTFLADDLIESLGVVNLQSVQELKRNYWNGAEYLYHRIWVLVLLHKWLVEIK